MPTRSKLPGLLRGSTPSATLDVADDLATERSSDALPQESCARGMQHTRAAGRYTPWTPSREAKQQLEASGGKAAPIRPSMRASIGGRLPTTRPSELATTPRSTFKQSNECASARVSIARVNTGEEAAPQHGPPSKEEAVPATPPPDMDKHHAATMLKLAEELGREQAVSVGPSMLAACAEWGWAVCWAVQLYAMQLYALCGRLLDYGFRQRQCLGPGSVRMTAWLALQCSDNSGALAVDTARLIC
ncbi:hypothetical protein HaLaN_16193 [Haematococcus lacustris]|uniref:Uncharacterized protein n=1 Tax=Haematococcus lacustris TaxID=44745 RepID=A0A699Z9I1_HAELA|nr:hypothetical protein HaLaN_16193 [Haematococcus lacustris]